MLAGFETRRIETADGVRIHVQTAGDGPPVLLLHGFPQSLLMWRKVAPALATEHRVVALDLRGYGLSDRPPTTPDHAPYAFRAMARDAVDVLQALGIDRVAVVGHDRGGRVAHRLALDHPERVERVAVLDIMPTLTMYETADRAFAHAYWHWFFLPLAELPEALLGAAPEAFMRFTLGDVVASGAIEEEAFAAYLRAFAAPGAIRAMCEDYRAAATIDLEHDRADLGRRLPMPLLALWGSENPVWEGRDVLAAWRERAAG